MALLHRDGYSVPALSSVYDSLLSASDSITLLPRNSFQLVDCLFSLVLSSAGLGELSDRLLDEPDYASQGFAVTEAGREQTQALTRSIVQLRADLPINDHAALKAFLIVCLSVSSSGPSDV